MNADTFYRELNKLVASFPKNPAEILNSENTEYGTSVYYCNNVYNGFDVSNSKDCANIQDSFLCVNCYDVDYTSESEFCYESVDVFKCYNCTYLEDCANMRDSDFCSRCNNCHDVFGCVRLRNKAFCIFNRQLSEAEYKDKIKIYKSWPAEKILKTVEELNNRFPVTQTHEDFNENSPFGNYVYYNKNCYSCFDATNNEYCGYLYDAHKNRTCYDTTLSGENQLSYEVIDSALLFNCNYVIWSKSCQNGWYLFNCFDVKDSIGCFCLEHKQYCILNRQLTKEEYERVSTPLLADLKTKNLGWNELVY